MATGRKVFLSYAREDLGRVERLYDELRNAGLEPWMDTRDLLPGEAWATALRKAVQSADLFVACLSVHSVRKRGFVQREIRQALDLWQERLEDDIYLIPVRLDDCVVPESLARFQWVDLFDFSGEAWARLLRALNQGTDQSCLTARTPAPAGPISLGSSEPAALSMARRALNILAQQAAGYTSLTIPANLRIELEDKRREVAELERLWLNG